MLIAAGRRTLGRTVFGITDCTELTEKRLVGRLRPGLGLRLTEEESEMPRVIRSVDRRETCDIYG